MAHGSRGGSRPRGGAELGRRGAELGGSAGREEERERFGFWERGRGEEEGRRSEGLNALLLLQVKLLMS